MPLDPQIAGLIALVEAGTPMSQQTPDEARASFRALAVDLRQPEHLVPVESVSETVVAGRPARVYRPAATRGATVALFHGGGFVIGDLDTHDNLSRQICRDTSSVVVSVDYRLAPEHPFPAAVDDCVAAAREILDRLDEFGADGRLAVAGDSAGGNLAAVVAQQVPGIVAQFLIYPTVDGGGSYASREENGHGYFLDKPTMKWFVDHYAPDGDETDPRLSPLRAPSLEGLPPAVIVTAEFDPLRDEGEAYAAALSQAGVRVDVQRYEGLIHGFMDMGPWSTVAQAAVEDAVRRFGVLLDGAVENR